MTLRFLILYITVLTLTLLACKDEKVGADFAFATAPKHQALAASKIVTLENKGIGPIDSVHLKEGIDTKLAKLGQQLYTSKCNACHKADTTFIGPPPVGILDRRSPEWIMNMILSRSLETPFH